MTEYTEYFVAVDETEYDVKGRYFYAYMIEVRHLKPEVEPGRVMQIQLDNTNITNSQPFKLEKKYVYRVTGTLIGKRFTTNEFQPYTKMNDSRDNGHTGKELLELYRTKLIEDRKSKQESQEGEKKTAVSKEYESDLGFVIRVVEMIEDGKKQFVLTGAPGTGKTHAVLDMAKFYNTAIESKDYFVQFHPSYDYVDFIEGLRPIQNDDEKGEMFFARIDGIFKRFCRTVVENNISANCYFVIDEINRADLSKVFGELMYCLEEDKRGKDNCIATQYQNIPTYKNVDGRWEIDEKDVFKDGFYIPENVIIIGTMNDIDRSVETFDFALRRRFCWIEAGELDKDNDYEEYKEYLITMLREMVVPAAAIEKLSDRILNMNKIIIGDTELTVSGKMFGLNEAYAIGPTYFKDCHWDDENVTSMDEEFTRIWKNHIHPLLKEYCRGQDPDSVAELCENCRNALLGGSEGQ